MRHMLKLIPLSLLLCTLTSPVALGNEVRSNGPAGAFLERYFRPWTQEAREENWTGWHQEILNGQHLGSNLRPVDRSTKEAWLNRALSAAAVNLKGISIKEAHLRVLPTEEPLFEPPGGPKTSYPFDRLQNGTVHPMEPLSITRRGGGWLLVTTPWASGWVREDAVAIVDPPLMTRIMSMPMLAVVRDRTVITYTSGISALEAHIGALIPMGEDGEPMVIRWDPSEGTASLVPARAPEGTLKPFPLEPSRELLSQIASSMLGQPYGWGGQNWNRDCSSTTRDIFTPFGSWIPRNSRGQGDLSGVDLSNLGRTAKARTIVERGVPFMTILYMRGHVMLYTGSQGLNPTVLHNIWSVKRGGQEEVIGRCVVTDLNIGEPPLIDRVIKMVFPSFPPGVCYTSP